jgi:hypothetical protein
MFISCLSLNKHVKSFPNRRDESRRPYFSGFKKKEKKRSVTKTSASIDDKKKSGIEV